MKKVILLGDSIRLIGYGKHVPSLLGSEYKVWQPEDNCRFAAYTLRMLYDYRNELQGADIIHWNNGLWDLTDIVDGKPFTPFDEYIALLLRIQNTLKKFAPRIIFATTTPTKGCSDHSIERTVLYNSAAVKALSAEGAEINDIFATVSADIPAMICSDLIHLSEHGEITVAHQVAEAIKKPIA